MKKKFGSYQVEITNPEKILLPESISKQDIINYYAAIAPWMVPYVKNRPLMMHRFPEGLAGESFYQKDASAYFPSWIKRAKIPKEGGSNEYVVCQNQATLVYLANQACITPHIWLSRIDKIQFPDRMIFDLDPSGQDSPSQDSPSQDSLGDSFSLVRTLALTLKELLETLGLRSFAMTTGSRGIHVVTPLDRSLDFKQVREFATLCARTVIAEHQDTATLEIRKNKRGNKVFIDTLRNQYGATAVAPYALRAIKNGPVATPLHWHELESSVLTPQLYTMNNLFERLESIDDPWKEVLKLRQSLKRPLQKITKLGHKL